MTPRFSVLLPTHNRADVLGYAIQSVLRQTEPELELLIVGDGCTDNTAEVVASFADPRIRWFDLPKAPHFGYANRNIALKQARGEFIAFMAHDDLVFDDHLALLAATLEETGAEWAYSRPLSVDLDGTVLVHPINLSNAQELKVFMTRWNSIFASCVMHRRSCFDKYGYWPEDVPKAADWRFWQRIIEGGGRRNFAHCREPTCLHFVANWRKADEIVRVDSLKPLQAKGWMPVVARIEIAQGPTAQQVFFELMRRPDWVADLRKRCQLALDRMAWAGLREIAPDWSALKREVTQLRGEIGRLKSELDEKARREGNLSQELKAVYASRSWRFTAPLRRLRQMLAGPRKA